MNKPFDQMTEQEILDLAKERLQEFFNRKKATS